MLQCNNTNNIRKVAKKAPSLKKNLKKNLNLTITLLNNIFQRLQLKNKNFEIFKSTSELNINIM
jgi:hypothetical protein